MSLPRMPRLWFALGVAAAALTGVLAYRLTRPGRGLHVAVVFTSRSEAVSFSAAAPEGEGFTAPGQRLWTAREGRLRLLTPGGAVRELTWGRQLPDGGTLIDVMSPSVSLDGKRVLFAGRKGDGHGRFRLYEVGVDGTGLRAITGGSGDEGCVELPPLRRRIDGSIIPDSERRATDYDDVDPIELNLTDRRIVFVSSRTPDLGRDHARRSTTLWVLHADGRKHPASANRNNDRWPFLLRSRYVAFSLWSRNREVVAADRSDVRPFDPKAPGATPPTDAWLGAFTQVPGEHFGMLIKPRQPVWRPRPLFANRIAFMTTFTEPGRSGDASPLTVAQAEPGLLAHAPSAQVPDQPLPRPEGPLLRRGPDRDAEGRPLWLATPSPCPPAHVLLSGATVQEREAVPEPGAYGLYLARDDWPEGGPASAAGIGLRLLFDDPDLVDAEPVAVYARGIRRYSPPKEAVLPGPPSAELRLLSGQVYRGRPGSVLATAIDSKTPMGDLPGQRTDIGESPIFASPPPGAIDRLRIYAARRDRFDDPVRPRIMGEWEAILDVPVQAGSAATWVPTDVPTVLAGFDREGRIAEWRTAAKDEQGRQARFYAYAGDHYSLARPGGKHFCVGCHPGHSGLDRAHHDHAERLE